MKKFSNFYIFMFSAIMVVIVALILSVVALQLEPIQEKNIAVEKMRNILTSIHVKSTPQNSLELFDQYITESYVVNYKGERLEKVDVASVDMQEEYDKIIAVENLEAELVEPQVSPFMEFVSNIIKFEETDTAKIREKIREIQETRLLPVYQGSINDTTQVYIFPMYGKGLWGPIWGYAAMSGDFNTIYGVYFSHKSETPGLGAEIATYEYQKKFIGRKIYDDNDVFVSIRVMKGGAPVDDLHGVDAISGGTITSQGLERMIENFLGSYDNFFQKKLNQDEQ